MGFFDFFAKAQKNIVERSENIQKNIEQLNGKATSYPYEKVGTELNNKLLNKIETIGAKTEHTTNQTKRTTGIRHIKHRLDRDAKKIIKRFYSDYPEIPYISYDRDENWIEMAEMFPNRCIVTKDMMTRYDDDLLPGHVYMLYWLGEFTNKSVPEYFEYKYGIDFEEEKEILHEYDFLDDNGKPTEKGKKAIEIHHEVIEKHTNKHDTSIEDAAVQIIKQKHDFEEMDFEEYTFQANSNCCDKCKSLNGQHFKLSEMKIGENAPPMHEGCACSISAYEDNNEYEAWLDFLANGGTTEEWEKKCKAK